MSKLAAKTATETLGEVLPIRKYMEGKRSKVSDAAVEAEVAHGPEFRAVKKLQDAELKLRAARELAQQAIDDVMAAAIILKARVPVEAAQVEMFNLDDGTWRVVVKGGEDEPAPPPAKDEAEEAAPGGDPGQLTLLPGGDGAPPAPEPISDEMRKVAKKLTPPQTRALDLIAKRVGSQPVFKGADVNHKVANALVAKGLVVDAGGEAGLSPSPDGYDVITLLGLGIQPEELNGQAEDGEVAE